MDLLVYKVRVRLIFNFIHYRMRTSYKRATASPYERQVWGAGQRASASRSLAGRLLSQIEPPLAFRDQISP
eukprot:6175097-Pleurochrysis_carterae.AAC.3